MTARTTVVHTGVEIPAVDPRLAVSQVHEIAGVEPVIMLVGRLDPVKGHHDLLAAAPPGTKLLFVGDADATNRSYAADLAVSAGTRAMFLGHRDDARELMAGADVIAVPSRTEGFGLVALEAMALGVPVVGYAAGALPEVVGDCAVLVPTGDVDALRDALSLVIRDSALRARLLSCGRDRAESHFGIDRWIAEMRAVYSSVSVG
jgi:glycosyltransferase involved in cell wall biosynthesis